MTNTPHNEGLWQEITAYPEDLRAADTTEGIKHRPAIAATREAYKRCGKDPSHPAYGITASGTEATQGRTIATDPSVIPTGSVVYFEGIDGLTGGYIAEDTGAAIKGNKIDLFFDSHQDALEWGVQSREVFVIE